MPPREEPSFYLYSRGFSPKVLTLGTLVYGNYGMPEVRRVTFPMSAQQYDELEKNGDIVSQELSGCFTYDRRRKYGLGLNLAEVASVDFEYARSCQKLVQAKIGHRVVLNSPDDFFEQVLSRPEILEKLTTWITVAKSAWLFYKSTFQKPRIYCCTGFYRLSEVRARVQHGDSLSAKISVSPEVIAMASGGVPIGGTIGPFANGQTLKSQTIHPETGIWAARYHQLKVEYLQLATQQTTHPAPSIRHAQNVRLREDCTYPSCGPMPEPFIKETRVVLEQDEIRHATGFRTSVMPAEEVMDDDEPDSEYWQAFGRAEIMFEGIDEEDSDSGSEQGAVALVHFANSVNDSHSLSNFAIDSVPAEDPYLIIHPAADVCSRISTTEVSLKESLEHRFATDIIMRSLKVLLERRLQSSPIGIMVLRYLRPKLRTGLTRIEWTCPCGVLLYGDYNTEALGSAQTLEASLRECAAPTPCGGASSTNSPYLGGQGRYSGPSGSASTHSVDITDMRKSELHPKEDMLTKVQQRKNVSPNLRSFLELCVNTGPNETVLEEILIRNRDGHSIVDNDLRLFHEIRQAYYRASYKTRYRWFRIPWDVHFVQFSATKVYRGADLYRVGVYDKPKALPPEDQVFAGKYEYSPVPLLPDAPISSNEFLHFLSEHSFAADARNGSTPSRIFLQRFAKKCEESAKVGEDEFQLHWGVRVIEGPNTGLFVVVILATGFLCILTGCIVGALLGNAFQGFSGAGVAFAISFATLNFVYTTMKDAGEREKSKTS